MECMVYESRKLESCKKEMGFMKINFLGIINKINTGSITCPRPVSVEHADIRVKNYSLSSRERYTCNSGFKRKAGTSSLTECVLDETTNTAHWTTPNLKCIRDPSLTHQMPVSPSTVPTTRVTAQPESLTPSRKEPEASTPKSDTTVTTETAIGPGSRLLPSEPPSAGTTGIVRNGSSPAPPQTAAKTLEPILPASHATPADASSGNATTVTGTSTAISVAASIVILIIGAGVAAFIRYCRERRQQPPAPNVEMEDMPMTAEASNREENTEDHQHNL
ncbi:PREDICTED: interleukin-15 receptor subunit alpha [Elephantulus edwardii]|uniref:interleukin-15 receptor subunit alpha n=1 Tax=Elephantulus edwardii TaxID=28737 RepID=UPI0003F095B7|nr:PREDICTED: interleukin-15 receptor subunit alpha [Elephantulus edwardii]